MRVVDVLYSLPYIFLVILLLVFFERSLVMLFVALGLVQWLTMARIVRGQVLSLKQQTFVEAARALGASDGAIIFRHLVPNTLGPVIVYTTLTVPAVILQEAFLSFLGLGVQPPAASWGTLVSDGARVLAIFPWLVIFPGLALSLTLLAFNFLGRRAARRARSAGPPRRLLIPGRGQRHCTLIALSSRHGPRFPEPGDLPTQAVVSFSFQSVRAALVYNGNEHVLRSSERRSRLWEDRVKTHHVTHTFGRPARHVAGAS